MFRHGILAGCLLLAGLPAAPLLAQEDDFTSRETPIPIFAPAGPDGTSSGRLQLTIDPLLSQRAVNTEGVQADSADEHFDLGYHVPLLSPFTVGWDSGVNAFRQDQTIFDDDGVTSQVTTAFTQKASVEAQAGPQAKLTGYVQGQRSFTDGTSAYTDSSKYGTEAAWTPRKDFTTLKIQAARQETIQIDRSILEEDTATAALDQKLPVLPLTLHTGGSLTGDRVRLLPAQDKDSTVADASVEWKICSAASCSTGYHRQDALTPAAQHFENDDAYFTQLVLQPVSAWGVTMRAAREQKAVRAVEFAATNSADTLLTLGVNWKLADRWNAGFGVNYRFAPASASAAQAQSTPPASFSVSAGGNF